MAAAGRQAPPMLSPTALWVIWEPESDVTDGVAGVGWGFFSSLGMHLKTSLSLLCFSLTSHTEHIIANTAGCPTI